MSKFVSLRRAATAAAMITLSLAVSGCSTTPESSEPACPRVSVLSEAAMLTKFAAGRGQDLTDVDYQAQVNDVRSQCERVGDGGTVVVALAPMITATRGPANADRSARFEYFVSVTDESRHILNVARFPVSIEFPGNRSRVSVTDDDPPVTVQIPQSKKAGSQSFEVFVGLQLTPDELEYNRRRPDVMR